MIFTGIERLPSVPRPPARFAWARLYQQQTAHLIVADVLGELTGRPVREVTACGIQAVTAPGAVDPAFARKCQKCARRAAAMSKEGSK